MLPFHFSYRFGAPQKKEGGGSSRSLTIEIIVCFSYKDTQFTNHLVKMPFIHLWTNLPAAKLDADFRRAFVETVAGTLQKPADKTMLTVQAGPECCQVGLNPEEHVMILNIKAIGHLSAQENSGHAKAISDFVQAHLGIPAEKVRIHFENLEKHEVSVGGTTYEAMMSGGK